MDWLTEHKIPIGQWSKAVIDWLTVNAALFFDALAVSLETLTGGLLWLLQKPSPLLVIVVLAAVTHWWHRRLARTLLVVFALLLAINQGYWEETTETLALILAATVICMAIGVPLGIAAAHRPWLFTAMRPVLDLMQTIPTFVYLIPALILFGLGLVPALVATIVFALPASVRLTHLGVSSTPKTLLEAGDAFGCTKRQLLFKVELPHALPQIMVGMTQTIMLSLSMVVIAALVGADGLGVPVLRALNQVNAAKGFETGFIIVFVAIMLDRLFRQREMPAKKGWVGQLIAKFRQQ